MRRWCVWYWNGLSQTEAPQQPRQTDSNDEFVAGGSGGKSAAWFHVQHGASCIVVEEKGAVVGSTAQQQHNEDKALLQHVPAPLRV